MPKVSKSKMGAFLAEIKQDGVKTVYADPKNIAGSKMDALWTTKEAKYVIIKNNATKYKNKKIGKEFQVRSNEDISAFPHSIAVSTQTRSPSPTSFLWPFAYQS